MVLARLLIIFAVGYVIGLMAGFSGHQSFLIGIIGAWISDLERWRGTEPLTFHVTPKWEPLLVDHNLVKKSEWATFLHELNRKGLNNEGLAKWGSLSFTIVKPGLVFGRVFGSTIKGGYDIPLPTDGKDHLPWHRAYWYVRQDQSKTGLIEIGLRPPLSMTKSIGPNVDASNVPIAFLPIEQLRLPSDLGYDERRIVSSRILKSLGWEREDYRVEGHTPASTFKHKYVTIDL